MGGDGAYCSPRRGRLVRRPAVTARGGMLTPAWGPRGPKPALRCFAAGWGRAGFVSRRRRRATGASAPSELRPPQSPRRALGAPVRGLSRRFCPQAKRRDPSEWQWGCGQARIAPSATGVRDGAARRCPPAPCPGQSAGAVRLGSFPRQVVRDCVRSPPPALVLRPSNGDAVTLVTVARFPHEKSQSAGQATSHFLWGTTLGTLPRRRSGGNCIATPPAWPHRALPSAAQALGRRYFAEHHVGE